MTRLGDDWALLHRYATDRDEPSFAELVRRHVNLVYSAAARRVGDRHLAEDVTQAVFVILARKAKSLTRSSSGTISAWLLSTVRYASANATRMETRRRRHELNARPSPSQGFSGACSSNPSDVIVWSELAQHLDDAVLKLPALDRQAVLLRYFEDRPIRDIAAALNVSEGAAKQRLSRAVDKLRERLDRKGAGLAGMSAAAFGTLLAEHAVRAAPAGLTHAATTAACVFATGSAIAGAASTTATSIAKGVIDMMTWTKAKIIAASIAAVAVGGAGSFVAVKSAVAA